MSDLDSIGTLQPETREAFTAVDNPATKNHAESAAALGKRSDDTGDTIETRLPHEQVSSDQAQPTSLARGVHGGGPGEEAYGKTYEDVGRHTELDSDQMAAPGEGKVYNAVEGWGSEGKTGASGSQPDLASDLDRKKAEQEPLRAKIKSERQRDMDVGGMLGQTGGPANPVD